MNDFNVFNFDDYRAYLKKVFEGRGAQRGNRIHLAKALQCQTSFISQVLTDRAHLSLEHAFRTSQFLNHTEEERNYFMLLVQKGKAGSHLLENYFEEQLAAIRNRRQEIRERIKVKTTLTPEDQMQYYSAWYYVALHILSALPGLNTPAAMAKKLNLDLEVVKPALEFLELKGFIRLKGNGYAIGSTRYHLPKGSPMLSRHHLNWRMRAIDSIDRERTDELHYSALFGISKKDQKVFRERLLQLIEEFEPIVRDSKEEVPVALVIDLFGI